MIEVRGAHPKMVLPARLEVCETIKIYSLASMGPEASSRLLILDLRRRSKDTKMQFALHLIVMLAFAVLVYMDNFMLICILAYLQLDPTTFPEWISERRKRWFGRRVRRAVVLICQLVRGRLFRCSHRVPATGIVVHPRRFVCRFES